MLFLAPSPILLPAGLFKIPVRPETIVLQGAPAQLYHETERVRVYKVQAAQPFVMVYRYDLRLGWLLKAWFPFAPRSVTPVLSFEDGLKQVPF